MAATAATEAPVLDHDAWMAIATEEYRRLSDLLRSLDEAEWSLPTDCPGWDVRAMVAHLCGAAEGNARLRESLRQAAVGVRRFRRPVLVDSINEVQIAERADRTPAQLVAELDDSGRRGVAARSRLPRVVRSVVVPFGPPLGTKSVGYLMDRIYTRDAWMHRIDIARATGRELVPTADHDGLLVRDVVVEWAAAHGRRFDLELTGPAGLRLSRGTGGPSLSLDAVEYARLMAGRGRGEGLLATTVPF
jgi:uncharacterized protein (TIGR03083 family)